MQKEISGSRYVPQTKFHFERQYENFLIWVVRATTDVRVFKNVRHRSVSGKHRNDYAHQNATEAVHATINKKILTLDIIITIICTDYP